VVYFSAPTSSFGYYRGTPLYGGSGSGMGPVMAGTGIFSAGQGNAGSTGWTPTILYMFVLIVVEMIVFGILARHV
jgi:hypothetical protein